EVALRIVWNSAIGPSLHLERVWPTTSQASAFSPCNITGFFRIYDSARDPLRVGSTGVGVALGTGVTTMVSLRRTRRPRIVARFNGKQLTAEAVSIEVARRYCELDGRSWNTQSSRNWTSKKAESPILLKHRIGELRADFDPKGARRPSPQENYQCLWTGPHSEISWRRFLLQFHDHISKILELCRTHVFPAETSRECTGFVR